MDFARVLEIHGGSDGEATKALYADLMSIGLKGAIAVNLFRAQKASGRAKVYRGGQRGRGSYRGMAYDKKNWALANLCALLDGNAAQAGLAWGWGLDEKQEYHRHVLYVDLPTGQVSFHAAARLTGPDYPGQWDGRKNMSATRICRWVAQLLEETA